MFCPICGGRSFRDFRGRSAVLCGDCGSLERHRIFGLFLMERLPTLADRSVHLLDPAPFGPLRRIAPDLFRVTPLAALPAAQPLDALLLAQQFEGLGQPVADFLAEMRRIVSPDAFVAFTFPVTPGVESYRCATTAVDAGPPRRVEQFGPRALTWFATLPGWQVSEWRPEAFFGDTISVDAALRYSSPGGKPGNMLYVASAV